MTNTGISHSAGLDEYSRLHREATELKDAGDLDAAVQALLLANEIIGSGAAVTSPESWCRLPLFLQAAGRFDESMGEFERILRDVPQRVDLVHGNLPIDRKFHFVHSWARVVLEKQVLAMKRELKRRPLPKK